MLSLEENQFTKWRQDKTILENVGVSMSNSTINSTIAFININIESLQQVEKQWKGQEQESQIRHCQKTSEQSFKCSVIRVFGWMKTR